MEILIKTFSKPVSRNNHHRGSSMKTEIPIESDLKKKMQTPFWVPNNNSDLFVVRKILNEEKELKRNISNGKYNKSRNNALVKKGKEEIKPGLTIQDQLSLLEKNKKRSNTILKEDEEENNVYKELENKTLVIPQFQREKLSDLIANSRKLSLLKYSLKVKEERMLREEETYLNEIEAVKDNIFSMQKAKENFEEEFSMRFDKYIKFLSVEKEREKDELENMMFKRTKIDAGIRQLENKKNRQKETIEQYKEYKIFLLSIKERNLTLLTKKDVIGKAITQLRKQQITSTFVTQNSQDKKHILRLKRSDQKLRKEEDHISSTVTPELLLNVDKLLHKYPNKIFDEPRDLVEELKNLETLNIELLKKAGELNEVFNENNLEFNTINKENINNLDYLRNDNNKKEKLLKDLKERYKKLNEEKEQLHKYFDKYTNESNNITKTELNKSKINLKINNLFTICQSLTIYKDNNCRIEFAEKSKNKQIPLVKNITYIDMLRLIEKNFDYLIIRFQFFMDNNYQDLKKFEKEIDLEKKKKFTDEQKFESEIKKENLMKKILERFKKSSLLPKRKVAERIQPKLKKNNDFKFKNENDDDLKLEDLINYDEPSYK
jgi:hypothetical protein